MPVSIVTNKNTSKTIMKKIENAANGSLLKVKSVFFDFVKNDLIVLNIITPFLTQTMQ